MHYLLPFTSTLKILQLLLITGLCLGFFTLYQVPAGTKKNPVTFQSGDSTLYKTQVQPIFESHCKPCHFPGGKMYERMPFDRGETIIAHEAGIFKRIKVEAEIAVIKKYIQQQNL